MLRIRRPKTRNRVILLIGLLDLLASLSTANAAEDPPAHRDTWVGVNATKNMWQFYSGGTIAPFGHLHAEGWRLRASGGHGQYDYSGKRDNERRSFSGAVIYLDALVGYQAQWGPLTVKALAGIAFIEHRIGPIDPVANTGPAFGPKLQTELWYDAGNGYWASLNAAYTTAHDTFSVRARAAYRLTDEISLGPEIEIMDTAVDTAELESAYGRGGGFAAYCWGTGEVSASAGLAGDIDGSSSPYVTVNIYSHF